MQFYKLKSSSSQMFLVGSTGFESKYKNVYCIQQCIGEGVLYKLHIT